MSTSLRTSASSPVSASTSVSTPTADPAPVPTSASVPVSTPVSAATPTPLSGTTEKNFSVDKYFELQEKKLELEAKKRAGAAKTAWLRSFSCDSKPVAGTRRPREDDTDASSSKRPRRVSEAAPSTLEALAITSDPPAITLDPPIIPSEQRDVPRTDDSVREPWMPSESVITARYGRTIPLNVIPLYVDSRIVDDSEAASKHIEPMMNQRRDYYISLSASSGTGARRRLRGEAECPSGRHSVKAGIRLLTAPTKTRQLIASELFQLVSAS
ncbi:hypothetical protein PHMEG_00041209 [Phytophthora megakarya]|uniref:Uncharacterized protein n=1 Tax=Phytophthora megakarya TaxID=4795 RepID=A0A225UC67_9STRA|nr:hypothetical protein PHMEG_00041209 [Phytophthora megakarya]